jgi:hypothetical protein
MQINVAGAGVGGYPSPPPRASSMSPVAVTPLQQFFSLSTDYTARYNDLTTNETVEADESESAKDDVAENLAGVFEKACVISKPDDVDGDEIKKMSQCWSIERFRALSDWKDIAYFLWLVKGDAGKKLFLEVNRGRERTDRTEIEAVWSGAKTRK